MYPEDTDAAANPKSKDGLEWVVGRKYLTRDGEVIALTEIKNGDWSWPLVFGDIIVRDMYGREFSSEYLSHNDIVDYAEVKAAKRKPTEEEETPDTGVPKRKMTLPLDSEERKQYPLHEGCKKYFPAALAGVAKHSTDGNAKHNKGQPLHHSRGKSMDHLDCIERHMSDIDDILAYHKRNGSIDATKLITEVNALAWRALAYSQEIHEKFDGAPLAPNAWVDEEK